MTVQHRRQLGILVVLTLGLGLSSSGCTPDFEDPAVVKDLRFLAIKATPPEQVLFRTAAEVPPELLALLTGGKLPEQIPGVVAARIEPLLVDPRVDATARFEWQVWGCSPEERNCDEAKYKVQLGGGNDPLSQIAVDVTPNGALFENALLADTFRGFGGLPIMVELRVRDAERNAWVRAIKRLVYTFWLPYSPVPPNKQPNVNPALESVSLTIEDADEKEVQKLKLSDVTALLTLRRDYRLVIEPAITEASKESYDQVASDLDPDGKQLPTTRVQPLEECDKGEKRSKDEAVKCGTYFSYSFFTTAGSYSHAKTGGAPSAFFDNKKVKDLTSKWEPPKIDPKSSEAPVTEATLWLLVSDGRGGVTWTSFEVAIEEPPAT